MKRVLIILALAASTSWAGSTTNTAAVIAAVAGGGQVIERGDGFVVVRSDGSQVKAVKSSDGYWLSGPGINQRLIRRSDGYAVAPVEGNRQAADVTDRFQNYYSGKRAAKKSR